MTEGKFRPGKAPALLLTLAGTLVLWGILAVYYRRTALEDIKADLLTINSFKAAQIADWVDFHHRETLRLSRHPFLGEIVAEELARPGSRRSQLADWLKDHDTQKKYSGMALLKVKGEKIIATANYRGGASKEFQEALGKAGKKGQPVFTDLYLSSTGQPRMAMVSPIFRRGYASRPVCVLVATIDAETEFYSLVKADPLFFPSAESLLVRRRGDQALFLNPLDHNSEAALKFELPLSAEGLPAARALSGYKGFFEGEDYRGEKVYSGISSVSGTEWALITKIDKNIVLGPVRTKEWLALALLLAAAMAGYIGVTGVMDARERAAQEKIREGERRLAALLANLPGVAYSCLNDGDWTMEFLSAGCVSVTGYQPEAIIANRDLSFNELIVPEDRARVRQNIQEQIASGGTYLCTYSIKSKSGEVKTVWDQGRAFKGIYGEIERLEGYIQDITPLRQAEASLRQSEFVFSKFMEHSPVYVFFKDENMRALRLSRNFEKMLGRPLNDLLGKRMDELFPSDLARSMIADDKRVLAEGKQVEAVEELNGRTYRTIKFPIALEGKPAYLAGYTLDITEARRAEAISLARIRLLQFAAGHTLDELLEETLNEAERISGSLIGFIHFLEEDQETLWLQNWSTRTKAKFCSAEGKGSHYALSKAGVWTDCVRERRAVMHNDYASLPHRKGLPPGHAEVKRELVVPVFRGEKIVAILGVGNKASDYNEDDVHDISLLADLAWEIAERKKAEESLAKARERLELAAAAARFGVWDWDIARNVLVWDDRMLQLYGLEKENFKGAYEAWLNGVHPDDRAASDAASAQALSGEKDYNTEFRVVWPDGSVHHMKAEGVVFRDPAGKPLRMIGINYDITSHRRVEEELRLSSALMRNTQSLARIGGWEWDLERDSMRWTEEMYRIHDMEPGELEPGPEAHIERSERCYRQEDIPLVMAAFDRCVKNGEPYDLEVEFTSAKGRKMWVRTTGKAEMEGGRPVKVMGTLSDITERREAERKIQESEQRLRSLWTHMAEGVALHELVIDEAGRPADYRIVDINPQYETILGLRAEAVLGKLASEAYGVSPAPYLEKYGAVARSGVPEQLETYFEPLNKHFRISIAPWGRNGFATIFSDVTDQWTAQRALNQAAEEVRAKNKELEDLLYIASHDLRSPLVNIQGFSENLAKYFEEIRGIPGTNGSPRAAELLEKKIPEALNFISGSSGKMDTLINGLLRVSRLGRVPLNMTRLDMDAFVAGLLGTVAFQLKEAGAELRVAALPKCIGDPVQLTHVFTNLLENAIKYRSPDRRLEIEIGGRTDGGMAEYYVADNGTGLTEAEAAGTIWNMFYRGAARNKIKGEGVGLTAAKRIVDRHGGSISAERLGNGGSKFIVRLRAWEG